jgi:hypothetical protein
MVKPRKKTGQSSGHGTGGKGKGKGKETAKPPAPVVMEDALPWPRSTMTEARLLDLVNAGLLAPNPAEGPEEWQVPAVDHLEPEPPQGYVVSFVKFHRRGLGARPSRFMRALPNHFGVELQHFNPNSISLVAAYAAVCEGYLGMAPQWDFFTHTFCATLFTKAVKEKKTAGDDDDDDDEEEEDEEKEAGEEGKEKEAVEEGKVMEAVEEEEEKQKPNIRRYVRAGSCSLGVKRKQCWLSGSWATNNAGWDREWFYLRNEGGFFPMYTGAVLTEPGFNWRHGQPAARQRRMDVLTDAMGSLRNKRSDIHFLNIAHVVAEFHSRRVLPLVERPLRLDQMTADAAPALLVASRMSPEPLTPASVVARVRDAITSGRQFNEAQLGLFRMRPVDDLLGYVSFLPLEIYFVYFFRPSYLD